MIEVPPDRFEALVADALDDLPDAIARLIDNVVVVVEDGELDGEILGFYDGVPLTERHTYGLAAGGTLPMPDQIILYRYPICSVCDDEAGVVDEVIVTVVHEVAHHFGIDDDTLDELGWG